MALAALAATLGVMLVVPAIAIAQTSVVTQEDCDAGRIVRNGRTLTGEECERLIGQRINLADTGFEAWIIGAAGIALIGGAVVLRRRRPLGNLA